MRHSLKLLALLAAISVAPASAGPRVGLIAPAGLHSKCPYERAKAAAEWAAALRAAPTPKAPTTITLTDRVPADSSLLGASGGSGFLKP